MKPAKDNNRKTGMQSTPMNLGLTFNKGMLDKPEEHKHFIAKKWKDYESVIKDLLNDANSLSNFCIKATVDAEGLLVGASLKTIANKEDKIKLGMYFDYTTGLPLIKGHSIKGAVVDFLTLNDDFISELAGILEVKDPTSTAEWNKFKANGIQHIKFHDAIPDLQDQDIFRHYPRIKPKQNESKYLSDVFTPHPIDVTKEPNPLSHLRIKEGSCYIFPFSIPSDLQNTFQLVFGLTLRYSHLGSHRRYNLGRFRDIKEHDCAIIS